MTQSTRLAYAKKREKKTQPRKMEETTTMTKRNSNQLGGGQSHATLPRNPKKSFSLAMVQPQPRHSNQRIDARTDVSVHPSVGQGRSTSSSRRRINGDRSIDRAPGRGRNGGGCGEPGGLNSVFCCIASVNGRRVTCNSNSRCIWLIDGIES